MTDSEGPPPPPPPPPVAQPFAPIVPPGYLPMPAMRPSDVRLWAGAAHWTGLFGFVGPLLIMLLKGDENPFVKRQAVEALDFQITTAIAYLVTIVLCFVLVGFLLLPVVVVGHLTFTIIGGVKANNGEDYRYPINLRMIG